MNFPSLWMISLPGPTNFCPANDPADGVTSTFVKSPGLATSAPAPESTVISIILSPGRGPESCPSLEAFKGKKSRSQVSASSPKAETASWNSSSSFGAWRAPTTNSSKAAFSSATTRFSISFFSFLFKFFF